MRLSRRLLYLVCFLALAATPALAMARIGRPSASRALLLAVLLGTLAGCTGLFARRATWAALLLVPLAGLLLLRSELPPPPAVHGLTQLLSFYWGELGGGARSYVSQTLPFDYRASPDIRLLLITFVYLAVALAAVAALSLGRVVPALVVLLVPLGFGFTVDESSRVVWLPVAFLFLAGCTLMTSRSLTRGRWRPGDAAAGAGTAVLAALLALSLLGATSVASGRPWQNWHTWDPLGAHTGTRLVFNWMENFPGLLDPRHNGEVMRVTTAVPAYWRANALDEFTGTSWLSGAPSQQRLVSGQQGSATIYTVTPNAPQPPGQVVTQDFHITDLSTDYLFAGGEPRAVTVDQDLPVSTGASDALAVNRLVGPKLQYTVTATIPQLKPAELVGRGADYPAALQRDLALPFPHLADLRGGGERAWSGAMNGSARDREWLGLYRLDRRIVGDATDPYQIALLVEQYLRRSYLYSLTPPATSYQSPYAAFLFGTHTGFCQHFAGAMALLLRFNGVPARVAVGFTMGHRVDRSTFVVTRNDAHAWVEAYFPQVGWVSFDPTPGRSLPGLGASSTSAGFVDPFRHAGSTGGGSTSAAGQPVRNNAQKDPSTGESSGAVGPAVKGRGHWWLPWLALAAAATAWPLARMGRRRLRLHRGDASHRLHASLDALFLTLRDYGMPVSDAQTLEETARLLRERLGLEAGAVMARVQAVQFGGGVPGPQDVAAVGCLRRDAARRLRAHAGLRRRLAAGYGLTAARTPASR
jgi:protein-glutamine gamma-glutamyltransferase